MEFIAGGAALGAKSAFDYNRNNFLYDRRHRRRKNFKLMDFKIAQAAQWREDVRDLCSLTEYKMHVYLLVNILLLGHTIVLWCQGKLPYKTPNWLMTGYAIGTAGAMMFLLLSIWMAMHAAVSAQSYQVRLLVQLVRLPIPSWEEVEACRTYASEFESLEAKQMFRIPFVMGPQESLVTNPVAPDVPLVRQSHPTTENVTRVGSSSIASANEDGGNAASPEPAMPVAVDPWGLERSDAGIDHLETKMGAQVANLRHVKLARQAMAHWQSYDAFARISMSVGVDQLLLAMSYYILGYMLVEVGSRSAAAYGVVLLTAISQVLLRLDMSLTMLELHLLQALGSVGPICSTLAALQWSEKNYNMRTAEALLVVSFLTHSALIAVISALARVDDDSGVMLPGAFHSVLYLDVFQNDAAPPTELSELESRTGCPDSSTPQRDSPTEPTGALHKTPSSEASWEPCHSHEIMYDPAQFKDEEAHGNERGIGAVRHDADGRPRPLRPDDFAPEGFVEDLRSELNAPHATEGMNNQHFFSASSWLHKGKGTKVDDPGASAPIVTGHEGDSPMILPWQTFTCAMRSLSFAWLLAGIYFGISVLYLRDLKPKAKYKVARNRPDTRANETSLLDFRISTGVHQEIIHDLYLQEMNVSWQFSDAEPRSLACDTAGSHFVATDGLVMFSARLPDEIVVQGGQYPTPRLSFAEMPCSQTEGESMQDAAVACITTEHEDRACEALVLHRHGRRIAACPLPYHNDGTNCQGGSFAANVSDLWLRRLREISPANVRRSSAPVPHTRVEKVVSVASEADCGGECAILSDMWKQCTLLGTTHNRIVQVREHQLRGEMIPLEVLSSGIGLSHAVSGHVRPVDAKHLGVLQADGRAIQLLDSNGAQVAALELPEIVASGFCTGGGYLYLLGAGPSPTIWRTPFPLVD